MTLWTEGFVMSTSMGGKHRGGICPVCSFRILIRDGRLVEHIAMYDHIRSTERTCAGSGMKPMPEKILR